MKWFSLVLLGGMAMAQTHLTSPVVMDVPAGKSPTTMIYFTKATTQWPCVFSSTQPSICILGDGTPVYSIANGTFVSLKGQDGQLGPRGLDGADGQPGATGPQGAQGQPGVQGQPGANGAQGPSGATGPAGPQGPMGPVGPASKVVLPLTNITVSCPKGKGTIPAGFVSKGCTITQQ